jgi:hypothetical protein
MLFIGLFVFVVGTQVGRREPNAQRLIIPVVIVAVFGFKHLSIPGGSTGQLLVAAGIALGIVFGLLSLTMIRVEKDPQTSRLVTIAGLSYVLLWTIALVARLGFAYGSTHTGSSPTWPGSPSSIVFRPRRTRPRSCSGCCS